MRYNCDCGEYIFILNCIFINEYESTKSMFGIMVGMSKLRWVCQNHDDFTEATYFTEAT
jgi:hypothetical protein